MAWMHGVDSRTEMKCCGNFHVPRAFEVVFDMGARQVSVKSPRGPTSHMTSCCRCGKTFHSPSAKTGTKSPVGSPMFEGTFDVGCGMSARQVSKAAVAADHVISRVDGSIGRSVGRTIFVQSACENERGMPP